MDRHIDLDLSIARAERNGPVTFTYPFRATLHRPADKAAPSTIVFTRRDIPPNVRQNMYASPVDLRRTLPQGYGHYRQGSWDVNGVQWTLSPADAQRMLVWLDSLEEQGLAGLKGPDRPGPHYYGAEAPSYDLTLYPTRKRAEHANGYRARVFVFEDDAPTPLDRFHVGVMLENGTVLRGEGLAKVKERLARAPVFVLTHTYSGNISTWYIEESDRQALLVWLDAMEEQGLAGIKDIAPGKRIAPARAPWIPGVGVKVMEWPHLAPPGYRLFTEHVKTDNTRIGIRSVLYKPGAGPDPTNMLRDDEIGNVSGMVLSERFNRLTGKPNEGGKVLVVSNSYLRPNFQRQGLGPVMYEALLAAAYRLGARVVNGSVHSTPASGAWEKLAAKHGLAYRAHTMRDEPPDKTQDLSFDERYSSYSFPLKGVAGLKGVADSQEFDFENPDPRFPGERRIFKAQPRNRVIEWVRVIVSPDDGSKRTGFVRGWSPPDVLKYHLNASNRVIMFNGSTALFEAISEVEKTRMLVWLDAMEEQGLSGVGSVPGSAPLGDVHYPQQQEKAVMLNGAPLRGLGDGEPACKPGSVPFQRLELKRQKCARVQATSPGALVAVLRKELKDVAQEHTGVLLLNTRNDVISVVQVSQGGLDTVTVDPRVVFGAALVAGARALVLYHNHPSGDPTPSAQDIALTRQLKQMGQTLGVQVLDHLIITYDGYKSFLTEGIL